MQRENRNYFRVIGHLSSSGVLATWSRVAITHQVFDILVYSLYLARRFVVVGLPDVYCCSSRELLYTVVVASAEW